MNRGAAHPVTAFRNLTRNPTMSAATTPPSQTAPMRTSHREISIISHSTLVYYWPVWFFGLIFGFWTIMEPTKVAFVPPNAAVKVESDPNEQSNNRAQKKVTITYTVPANSSYVTSYAIYEPTSEADKTPHFRTTMSSAPYMGLIYVAIIFLTVLLYQRPLAWPLVGDCRGPGRHFGTDAAVLWRARRDYPVGGQHPPAHEQRLFTSAWPSRCSWPGC